MIFYSDLYCIVICKSRVQIDQSFDHMHLALIVIIGRDHLSILYHIPN